MIEAKLLRSGRVPVGVDEVGRGCLAGPVFAAAVILDFSRLERLDPEDKALIRDSKELSQAQRARIIPAIERSALAWHVAQASVEEIERLNIAQATFLAMRRALGRLTRAFDILLVDGKLRVAGHDGEQMTIVKGDSLCYSIAAASILAKEARDDYMRFQATRYPNYGFDSHVGYATKLHLAMIEQHGPCVLHRRNFDPIRKHGIPVVAAEGLFG